MPKIRRLAYM